MNQISPTDKLRNAALVACGHWLQAAGGFDPDAPVIVVVRGPQVALRWQDVLPFDSTQVREMARVPESWRRLLDVMAGAGDWLPAVEIERRLNGPAWKGDRVTPAVALRLQDMEDAGLVESGRAGYRLARVH